LSRSRRRRSNLSTTSEPETLIEATEPDAAMIAEEGASAAEPVSAPTGLSIATLPSGGLRIEAPPALAAPLAELLEGIARALRTASCPTISPNPSANGSNQSRAESS
jgi:hypothetical protein